MQLNRVLPLSVLLALALAGCFRQAGDAFESVDSEIPLVQEVTATPGVEIIDPNADADTQDDEEIDVSDDEEVIVESEDEDQPLVPADDSPSPTPTIIIIVPGSDQNITLTPRPTNTPGPPATQTLPVIATATGITVITPEPPAQLQFPTATPAADGEEEAGEPRTGTTGLVTPTALGETMDASCIHIVRAGENLFRIALNNNVALSDLLNVNNLTQNSIIQPGQELILPNCTPTDDEAAPPTTESIVDTTPPPSGTVIHTVASGETLGAIARRYGVTIQDIVAANELLNPDRLSIGQQLIIPNQ